MEMISLFLVTVVCKICLLTFFYTIQTSGSKPLNKLPNQKLNFSKSKIALKTEKALLRTSNLPLKSYFSCMVGSKPEKIPRYTKKNAPFWIDSRYPKNPNSGT